MDELSHEGARQAIEAAADGQLSPEQAGALRDHLDRCPDCRAYAAGLAGLERDLRRSLHAHWDGLPGPTKLRPGAVRAAYRREGMNRQTYSWVGALALTVVILAALAAAFRWALPGPTPAAGPAPLETYPGPAYGQNPAYPSFPEWPAANPYPGMDSAWPTPVGPYPAPDLLQAGPIPLPGFHTGHPESIQWIEYGRSLEAASGGRVLEPVFLPAGCTLQKVGYNFETQTSGQIYACGSPGPDQAARATLLITQMENGGEAFRFPEGPGYERVLVGGVEGFLFAGLYDPAGAWQADENGRSLCWPAGGDAVCIQASASSGPDRLPVEDLFAVAESLSRPGDRPQPGGQIAFTSDRGGDPDIYTVDPNGAGLRNLTQSPARDLYPAYSPDGSRIAFLSDRVDGQTQVFVMDADGANVRQLTGLAYTPCEACPTPAPGDPAFPRWGRPAWSPDGTRIAAPVWQNAAAYFLAVLPLDGSEPSYLPTQNIGFDAPQWSPDGSQVAFTAGPPGAARIFIWDGTGTRELSEGADWREGGPLAWSPDGTQIAALGYRRVGELAEAALRIFSLAGGEPQVIYELGRYMEVGLVFEPGSVAWLPDGSRVLFYMALPPYESRMPAVNAIRPDGGDLRHLVTVFGTAGCLNPSPDGRWLVFNMEGRLYRLDLAAALQGDAASGETTPVAIVDRAAAPDWAP